MYVCRAARAPGEVETAVFFAVISFDSSSTSVPNSRNIKPQGPSPEYFWVGQDAHYSIARTVRVRVWVSHLDGHRGHAHTIRAYWLLRMTIDQRTGRLRLPPANALAHSLADPPHHTICHLHAVIVR